MVRMEVIKSFHPPKRLRRNHIQYKLQNNKINSSCYVKKLTLPSSSFYFFSFSKPKSIVTTTPLKLNSQIFILPNEILIHIFNYLNGNKY